jgi:hypothetical protein
MGLCEEILAILRERDQLQVSREFASQSWLIRAVEILLRAELQRQNGVKKNG